MCGPHSPGFLSHILSLLRISGLCVYCRLGFTHLLERSVPCNYLCGVRESVAVGTSHKHSSLHSSPPHTVCEGHAEMGDSDGCVGGRRIGRKRMVGGGRKSLRRNPPLYTPSSKHLRLTEMIQPSTILR